MRLTSEFWWIRQIIKLTLLPQVDLISVTGLPSDVKFTSWSSNQPDDPTPTCISIDYANFPNWKDWNCSFLTQYICQGKALSYILTHVYHHLSRQCSSRPIVGLIVGVFQPCQFERMASTNRSITSAAQTEIIIVTLSLSQTFNFIDRAYAPSLPL